MDLSPYYNVSAPRSSLQCTNVLPFTPVVVQQDPLCFRFPITTRLEHTGIEVGRLESAG